MWRNFCRAMLRVVQGAHVVRRALHGHDSLYGYDKEDDVKEFLQGFADISKELLRKDGFVTPVMMWFRDKQPVMEPQRFIYFKEHKINMVVYMRAEVFCWIYEKLLRSFCSW